MGYPAWLAAAQPAACGVLMERSNPRLSRRVTVKKASGPRALEKFPAAQRGRAEELGHAAVARLVYLRI